MRSSQSHDCSCTTGCSSSHCRSRRTHAARSWSSPLARRGRLRGLRRHAGDVFYEPLSLGLLQSMCLRSGLVIRIRTGKLRAGGLEPRRQAPPAPADSAESTSRAPRAPAGCAPRLHVLDQGAAVHRAAPLKKAEVCPHVELARLLPPQIGIGNARRLNANGRSLPESGGCSTG